MHTFPRCLRPTLILAWLLGWSIAPARANIRNYAGDLEGVTPADVPGGSLLQDAYESDTHIRVILEKANVLLAAPLSVDIISSGSYGTPLTPGVIAAGEYVTSYLFHADPAAMGATTFAASVQFGEDILGIIALESSLTASDGVLGLTPPLTYPARGGIASTGLEFTGANLDVIDYHGATRIIDLSLTSTNQMDELRVIVRGQSSGVSFGIDRQSFSWGLGAAWGGSLTDDAVMTNGDPGAPGPNPAIISPTAPPGIMLDYLDLKVTNAGLNSAREVDAISFGHDYGSRLLFSVDEFAQGVAGTGSDVASEGSTGRQEASADVFMMKGPLRPLPAMSILGNARRFDGHGDAGEGAGFNLVEPNPITPENPVDPGDNLDAFDLGTTAGDLTGPIYFSLDYDFADPLETPPPHMPPPNYGTAPANGVTGAHILVITPGDPGFAIFADPVDLGLIQEGGDCNDDVDAILVIDRNENQVFDNGTDKLYYSLRRGSPTILAHTLDARLGLMITEADILQPGNPTANPPEIVVPGEDMGLNVCRGCPIPSDELDAIDASIVPGVPVANPDVGAYGANGWVVVNLVANDVAMRGHLEPQSCSIAVQPEGGTVMVDLQTGEATYTNTNPNLSQDTFSYTISDDSGNVSDLGVVTLTLDPSAVGEGTRPPAEISFAGPNPFRESTSFSIRSAQGGRMRVEVYGPSGRKVRNLLDRDLAPGQGLIVPWDGRNERGQEVAAGVYLVRAIAPEGTTQLQAVRQR